MDLDERESELRMLKPPRDITFKVREFAKLIGMNNEKVKSEFYNALVLQSLDKFTDNDERCRQAFICMVNTLKHDMFPTDLLSNTTVDAFIKNDKSSKCVYCLLPDEYNDIFGDDDKFNVILDNDGCFIVVPSNTTKEKLIKRKYELREQNVKL